ncbi:MAG: hypothetical protein WCK15_07070, partial [Pirellula sp.]
FPGSAWERIAVEAPASRVHKLTMHFGEAEPRLHLVTRQSLVTGLHSATKLAIRATSQKLPIYLKWLAISAITS